MREFCFFILFLFSVYAQGQSADFFKEELSFVVDSQYFYMQGDFYLKPKSENVKEIRLTFPVPEGTMSKIDSFMVYDYHTQQSISYRKGKSEFGFTVPFSSQDTAIYNIQYRQKIEESESQLSYIITTVQYWSRPLQYASYSLSVPDYLLASDFSLEVDKQIKLPNKTVYLWERHMFMPKTDFSFLYRRE